MSKQPKKLIFFKDSRDYSGQECQEYIQDMVAELVNFNIQVYFKCLWGNDHIPTLDIDSNEEYLSAKTILESKQVPFVTIQSSPNRFWILVDRLESHFDHAADIIHGLPCDQKYVDLCSKRKSYTLRAGVKNGYIPFILKPKGNDFSQEFREFIDAVNNYLNSDYASIMRAWIILEQAKSKARNSAIPILPVASVFNSPVIKEKVEETWDIL